MKNLTFAALALVLVACSAAPEESAASAAAVETSDVVTIYDGPVALTTLTTPHVSVYLDVPGLYMCGAKIVFAADAPDGLETALVRDEASEFGLEFDVKRSSPREIRFEIEPRPHGWSGIIHVTTTDGRPVADVFAGHEGTIEQLFCAKPTM